MFGKRILICVPHPDDELVACGAAVGRAQRQGAELFAIYLTHGCIARETMWPWRRGSFEACVARRRLEGEAVAKALGITAISWSLRPARTLWQSLPSVENEIMEAIKSYKIDQLWVPAYEGGNADHDGLNAVAEQISAKTHRDKTAPPLSVLEFAEYNFAGGKAHSQTFPLPNGTEQTLALLSEERRAKAEALATYVSEKANLNYVKVDRECWRPLAHYDYAKPPHEGTLWYARFQWVPFRHPRVDFTDPKNVSEAIQDYRNDASR